MFSTYCALMPKAVMIFSYASEFYRIISASSLPRPISCQQCRNFRDAPQIISLFTISACLRLWLNGNFSFLEFLNKYKVCRSKIKLSKLFQRYPLKIIVVFKINFPFFPIRTIGQKLDRDVIIMIPQMSVLNCAIVCLKKINHYFDRLWYCTTKHISIH